MNVQTTPLLRYGLVGMIVFLLLAGGLPVSQVSAAASSTNVAAGRGPHAVAVNPVTSRIYVANADSDSVTVLEDTYGGGVVTVANIDVGTTPYALAVNPVTNKIYVANADSDTVTVIDGVTNNTIEVDVGILPFAVAVNTVTNKIYVANLGSDTVTVIDGATADMDTEAVTATIQVGESPFAIAVNEAANKIYVANVDGDTVTVIDGVSNSSSSVSTGAGPNALAVNPLTGSVYVANFYSNTVTVIDGTTGDVSTLNVGITPTAVEVNPVTGMIYVTNTTSNNVTVIDGANHSISTVSVGSGPSSLAINAETNKIHIANYDSNDVTVIDGRSQTTSTAAAGTNPIAAAVNIGLNKVYLANFNSDEITVIGEERAGDSEPNADLSKISVSAGALQPSFAPEVFSYSIEVSHTVSSISVTAVTYDPATTMRLNGQAYSGGVSNPISLQVGTNQILLVTAAADGFTSKTYTLTVIRAEAPIEYRPPNPPDTNTSEKTDTFQPESEDVEETASGATLTNRAAAFTVKATAETNGKAEATAMLHTESLMKAFRIIKGNAKGSQTILFELPGTEAIRNVGIPAQVLTAAASENPYALIKIKTENASYTLPIHFPTLTAQLKQLGGKLEHATFFVTMETLTDAAKEQMAEQAKTAGIMLVGDIIDFTLSIEVDGSKQVFTDFGRTYVSRSIVESGPKRNRVSEAIDPAQSTAIRLHPQTGEFSFVPSTFTTTNGLTEVHIFRTGNSLYTIAQSIRSFDDLQGHWSQTDVELLASKLIVNGQTETDFVPEGNVTRAEFVSLIIRALGLEEDSIPAFTDIGETDWFAGAIGAAVRAQIVSGFEDGTFRPNDTITREQMAVMLSNALLFANKPIAVAGKLLPLLAGFEDKSAISSWAQVAAAQMLESGMMRGITEHQFAPQDKATRAQAAVVIKRMLQTAGFMNE
ncbi:S-layer homology domain-containing protein [Paenibacillus contaminans]|uniref:SLH domain-containing protein n=1 Tax=Paenibacillus contaminans TaxID=450362 RepID=A0A329MQ43_9BACL|nr:S-layer homology domain-containing protein [Paenibacillus contaminans]RAV21406.1 hypothetical protein DQG23_08940 [Paenibacillus contaminans]